MLDRQTQVRVAVGFGALALALGGVLLATTRPRDRGTAGSESNPVVLVISPAYGDATLASDLGRALSEEAGVRIELRRASSRVDALTATSMPNVDGGILPLFDYLLARQELGVEATLQLTRGGGARDAASVLLVKDDSPITAVAGLADQPVAFVDHDSTTGYLLPAHLLKEQGVTVRPVFTGSHDASLAKLTAGDVAAAGTYAHDRPGFRVLASAGAAPNEPVFFHPRLPRATRDKVTAAFVTLAGKPGGRALFARMSDVTGVATVDDTAYAQVTSVLAATQQQLEDVVPGGRRLVQQLNAPSPTPD